jgi:hypothetical protein
VWFTGANWFTRATNIGRPTIAKEFPGSLRVPGNADWFAFADLYGSGSEVNEPLDASGFWSRSAKCVPDVLPGFVCFPVEPRVEEVEGVEPWRVGSEEGGESVVPGFRIDG